MSKVLTPKFRLGQRIRFFELNGTQRIGVITKIKRHWMVGKREIVVHCTDGADRVIPLASVTDVLGTS